MRGEIVTYKQPDSQTPVNGVREHPAMITRQHDATMVNLMVFFDGGTPTAITSVQHTSKAKPESMCWYYGEMDERLIEDFAPAPQGKAVRRPKVPK